MYCEREKVLVWPESCKLAHAFLCKCSHKRLQLAQLLGQLGVFLTWLPGSSGVPPFSGLNSVSIQIWQRAIPHGGRWQADGEGTHRLDREGGAGARRQRELGRVEGVVGVQPTQQRLGVLRRRRQLATGGRVIECQPPSARAQSYNIIQL